MCRRDHIYQRMFFGAVILQTPIRFVVNNIRDCLCGDYYSVNTKFLLVVCGLKNMIHMHTNRAVALMNDAAL